VRAVGYHESVAGPLDAEALDAIVTDRPVRVQHRSGALWILNTAGVRAAKVEQCTDAGVERDAAGRPTGRLFRMDEWLREQVPAVQGDLPALGREALTRGVTGFTDADPERTHDDVAALSALPQRLHLMGPPTMTIDTDDDSAGRLSLGPVKFMLDDDELPAIDDLVAKFTVTHEQQRRVAVHCATRAQLVLTVAAFEQAGASNGDRIEHGAVIPNELVNVIRRLGVTVVTQPNFIAERGDEYRREVDADDLPLLYRCRSLIDAEVPVAAGTDAPFGDADPWKAVQAAIDRRTPSGFVLGPGEAVPPARALALFLGEPTEPATLRLVQPGAVADLCVLRCPLAEAVQAPSADLVRATVINGTIAYQSDG
jgi:predicted amidohydrolase YtcJ